MKKAIIVGCNGQDGKLLERLLLRKQYEVLGLDKNFIKCPCDLEFGPVDIRNTKDVFDLINHFQPDEIYYLAAFHHSSEEIPIENIELFQWSHEIHVSTLFNFLEGIRRFSPKTRIFYAASSHIFGEPDDIMQNEKTSINPNCFYGITKAAGLFMCRLYRKNHSVFASTGILYNHESSFRSEKFVSKKIITAAINIKNKKQKKLVLGDLNAEIDWGYALDYVEAMHKIVNNQVPDDFIIATGKKHKVIDFVKISFGYLGLDWKEYVEEKGSVIRKKSFCRVGNPEKIMVNLGWKPSVDFNEMIKQLLIDEGAFNT